MLGALIYGALRAIVGVGKAVDNAQMKRESFSYTDKGEPTYYDRNGNRYINGEKVIATYDYDNHKLVYAGQRTGKVYYDPEQAQRDKLDGWSEKRKQMAISNGRLAYNKYNHDWETEITTEISTGRPIATLEARSDGTYWKQYGTIDKPKYKGEVYVGCMHEIGEPIQITREEYVNLKTVGGSHLIREGSLWI